MERKGKEKKNGKEGILAGGGAELDILTNIHPCGTPDQAAGERGDGHLHPLRRAHLLALRSRCKVNRFINSDLLDLPPFRRV